MSLERLVIGASALVLVAALVPSTPAAAGSRARCFTYNGSERSFARKINGARAGQGIRRLRLDPQLSRVARQHSQTMRRAGNIFHQTLTQWRKRITRWTYIGENVGTGFGIASLHRAFMASPGHRANILGRNYRHMGVAVTKTGDQMWVTVIFESVRNPGTTLPMPRC